MTPSSYKTLDLEAIRQFQDTVWRHFDEHGRKMPWREDPSPYKVLVSELMLQQTQVKRVIPKFDAFMYTCDNFAELASLPLAKVLELWSGLGYNRRARFLHESATVITRDFAGIMPSTYDELTRLPGIGPNTAGAILAYAFDQPVVFIETNIRSVLFHHFFHEDEKISDKELRHVAEQVLDSEHPRQWYWALMDYGTYIKSTQGGRLRTSAHYKKQSPLVGSVREIRGRIVKILTTGPVEYGQLQKLADGDERFCPAMQGLLRDGLVVKQGENLGLTGSIDAP